MNMTPYALENQFIRPLRLVLGMLLLLGLLAGAGCSTDNGEEEDAEYPNLNTVPEKPETVASLQEAEAIEEGLRGDREKAQYTDEVLRADTSLQPALATPPKVIVEEVKTEVVETAESKAVTKTDVPVVAKVEQEVVKEAALAPPAVPTTVTDTGLASATTTVVSSEGVTRPEVESVFEQQLAASSVTRLPNGMTAEGTATTAASTSTQTAPASTSNSDITLTRPSEDGGRIIRNYAASDGTTPIETVYFSQGSHRISSADKAMLDRIARTQTAAGGTLKIVGHASSRTRQMAETKHMIVNLNVSQQRAAAIAEYFIKAGVLPGDLVIESVSDTEPLTNEPMPNAEAMNRRAEIFLLN